MTEIAERVKNELYLQYKRFDDMSSSASIYSKNLVWQKLKKYVTQISLIDFDVIYNGILPLSSLNFSLNNENLKNKEFERSNGCNSIRYLFSKTKDYCLPFGTRNELIDKKFKIANKIGRRAEKFQETLIQSKDKSNPVSFILEKYSSKELNEIIMHEFEEINLNMDDYLFLDTVLANSLDIEKIISSDFEYDNSRTFKKAIDYLENERPDKFPNNLNDALNISTIPMIIGNKQGQEKSIPVFITQTEKIYKAGNIFSNTEDFEIFNKYYYLFFSQLISNYNDGDIDLCIRYSDALAKDLNSLKSTYFNLIVAINNNTTNTLDFNSRYYQRIEIQQKIFLDTWYWLFEPFISNSILDNISYKNSLVSNNVHDLLNSMNYSEIEIKEFIQKTIKILDDEIFSKTEINQILLLSNKEISRYILQNDKLRNIINLSYIHPEEDTGCPYSSILPATSLDTINVLESQMNGTRIFVNFKLGIIKGAVFSFDIFPNASKYKDCFGISWPHYCDKQHILSEMNSFLRQIYKDNIGLLKYKFTADNGHNIYKTYDEMVFDNNTRYPSDNNNYIFYSIFDENNHGFADLEANIEEIEMQAGLIIKKDLVFSYAKQIALLINNTSMLRSRSKTDFIELFSNVIYYLTKFFKYEK
jgi:hypothetical protein